MSQLILDDQLDAKEVLSPIGKWITVCITGLPGWKFLDAGGRVCDGNQWPAPRTAKAAVVEVQYGAR